MTSGGDSESDTNVKVCQVAGISGSRVMGYNIHLKRVDDEDRGKK